MPYRRLSPLTWVLGCAALLTFFYLLLSPDADFGDGERTVTPSGPTVATASPPPQALVDKDAIYKASLAATCAAELEDKKKHYKQFMAAGEYWNAARSMDGCHNLLNDDGLKKLVRDAEVKAYVKTATDMRVPTDERILAIEGFLRSYPAEASPYERMLAGLVAKVGQEAIAAKRKRANADAAQNESNKSINLGPQSDIFNANNNPKGTDCYRRVAYIRELENDARFDTNRAMRQEWQRQIDQADRLKCKL